MTPQPAELTPNDPEVNRLVEPQNAQPRGNSRGFLYLLLEKVLLPFLMVIVGVTVFEPVRAWWLGPNKYVICLIGRQDNPEVKQMFDVIEDDSQFKKLQIDGRPIEVQDFDDRGEIDRAEEIAVDLSSRPDTLMVIGHVTSQCTTVALPFYMTSVNPPVPVIATRETDPDTDLLKKSATCLVTGAYCPFLRMSPTNDDEVTTALDLAMGGIQSKKFLIVRQKGQNAEYTDSLAAEFQEQIEGRTGGTIVAVLDVDSTLASMDSVVGVLHRYSPDSVVFVGQPPTAERLVKVVTEGSRTGARVPMILLSDSAVNAKWFELKSVFYAMYPVSSQASQSLGKSYGDDAFALASSMVHEADSARLVDSASWLRHLVNMHRVRDARVAIAEVMKQHANGSPYLGGKYKVDLRYDLQNVHFHVWRVKNGQAIDVDKWNQPENPESGHATTVTTSVLLPASFR